MDGHPQHAHHPAWRGDGGLDVFGGQIADLEDKGWLDVLPGDPDAFILLPAAARRELGLAQEDQLKAFLEERSVQLKTPSSAPDFEPSEAREGWLVLHRL